ncbi:MAG: cyclic nucleotide-binding/CBS domain-containing protein [Paracoccaceae bacterium]
MKIKDRPEFTSKPKVLTLRPTETVREAVRRMCIHGYGSVVVIDENEQLIGIFTERDAMTRVIDKGLDPNETTLDQVVTRDVRVARADDLVIDWLRIMSNERFRRLPIVDENGKVVSMMTQGDFVSYTWPELLGQLSFTAKAAMGANTQLTIMMAGVLTYTLVLIGILVALV